MTNQEGNVLDLDAFVDELKAERSGKSVTIGGVTYQLGSSPPVRYRLVFETIKSRALEEMDQGVREPGPDGQPSFTSDEWLTIFATLLKAVMGEEGYAKWNTDIDGIELFRVATRLLGFWQPTRGVEDEGDVDPKG